MSKNDTYFETQHLSAGYNGKALVSEVNLEIRKGEILTLIGPNGSGKSTIIKTLSGHLAPVSGAIFLNGRPFSSYSRQERAKMIAVMLTDPLRTERMTGREVVEAGRHPYTGSLGILSADDHRAVSKALQSAHAEELCEQDFMALSDGQRQRILLARALAQEPGLLVLDEPTSYLDIRFQLELLDILRLQCNSNRTAVIMSLHELFLAERISDRIICVKNGQIDRTGTPGEIFSGDYIDVLYDLPRGTYASLLNKE